MGLFDYLKNKVATNLKVTKLSFMTRQSDIVAYCQNLNPAERQVVLKAIESSFKWQSVAQIAQALFPSFHSGAGVSVEALDLVKGGSISAGLELMRMQNQLMQANYRGA